MRDSTTPPCSVNTRRCNASVTSSRSVSALAHAALRLARHRRLTAYKSRQPSACVPCMPRPPADRPVSLGWYNDAVPWRLEPARSAARAGRGAAVEASARATSLLRRSVARACATRSRSMLHREDWSTTLAQRAGCGKALSGRNEARGRWARHVKMGVVESENAF